MDPPTTRYVQRDGNALAYQVLGDGQPEVVWYFEIGLHPDLMWTDPHLHYLFERTADRGRSVNMLRRGFGLSDPVDHVPDIDEQADDVLAVMDDAGISTATLSGTGSTCGPLVLVAARHPERVDALVLNQPIVEGLVQPDGGTPPGWEGHDPVAYVAGWRDVYAHWGSGRTLEMWDPSADSPLNRRLMGLLERSTATPTTARAHLEWLLRMNCWDALDSIQCPTRVLHPGGSPRPQSVCERITAAIPNATMYVLPEASPGASLAEAWLPVLEQVEQIDNHAATIGDVDRFLGCVLFTDVVDSTTTLAALGDHDYRDLLSAHERAVRDAVERHGGRLVNVSGDGTFSVFDGASDAVRCADTICRDGRRLGLAVRTGVHTGPLERSGPDLTGMTVHVGARIGALAGPGEVLVSRAVRDLTAGSGLRYTSRGSHVLKGVPGRWALFTLADTTRTVVPRHRPRLTAVDRAVLTAARRTPQILRAAVRMAYARQPSNKA
ncbi:Hydrolase [Rhodococcus sp. RD6.2]|uniref:adenylate/guanylate cyclase domain-containing protein n=1 Tax=Rhodococcus sp. RD6.2 TaxID=260936 RepID=UPI00063B291A|nr:adenylate/guanylate cyclase domain-containing protein [Rhodococcus sp. RD6.2]CRK53914.1 Hydrolase [Rhodococcus sp. RD6.2]